jgi:hypothetical protein
MYKLDDRETPKIKDSLVEKVYRFVVRETDKIGNGQTGMQTYSQVQKLTDLETERLARLLTDRQACRRIARCKG